MHIERAFSTKGVVAPSANVDFNGKWKNELNSTMTLTVNQDQTVSGKYTSAVGQFANKPMTLTGIASGDLLSFTVNFGDVAITSWTAHGVFDQGTSKILTLWQMVMAVQDETDPEVQWKTVLAGADEFSSVP